MAAAVHARFHNFAALMAFIFITAIRLDKGIQTQQKLLEERDERSCFANGSRCGL